MPAAWVLIAQLAMLHAAPAALPLISFSNLRGSPPPSLHGSPEIRAQLLDFRNLRAHDAIIAGMGDGGCRVVVATFAQMGKESGREWLANELPDSIARNLGGRAGVEFIRSDTVHSFARRFARSPSASLGADQLASLARRTDADVAIAGSYALTGERICVNIQAMRPSSGALSEPLRFEGSAASVWELEGRMAAAVAELLGVHLSDGERSLLMEALTPSAAAFEEFCKGRQAPDGSHTKIQYLQKAVEADPSFREAHYLLGNAYVGIGMTYGYVEWFNMALDEYRKAAALAPDDARVYCAMGLVYMLNGRPDLARRSLEDALRREPDLKLARSYLNRLEGMGM